MFAKKVYRLNINMIIDGQVIIETNNKLIFLRVSR